MEGLRRLEVACSRGRRKRLCLHWVCAITKCRREDRCSDFSRLIYQTIQHCQITSFTSTHHRLCIIILIQFTFTSGDPITTHKGFLCYRFKTTKIRSTSPESSLLSIPKCLVSIQDAEISTFRGGLNAGHFQSCCHVKQFVGGAGTDPTACMSTRQTMP